MTYLLVFVAALVISMTMIPLMVRAAPRLGMLDIPDRRKIHAQPVPRVGGIGIVAGTIVSVMFWAPLDNVMLAYLFGVLTLLAFGIWDDIRPQSFIVKFAGQFAAAVAVVYYGDLYITRLPFLELEAGAAEYVGKPFTVFAIVGMINALNTSDGLDGLAGGLSLLSLACIGILAFMSDGAMAMIVVLAAAGGVLGFLRYNTYPAMVFMGDAGSQFLGFTLGVLAILLTQVTNLAASPALPLLILGLPVFDLVTVAIRRHLRGEKWYLANKDHIHHRLLARGFDHYEAVVIIYSIQTLFIVSAIFLMYESDSLILSIYLGVCATVFAFLVITERQKWRAHMSKRPVGVAKIIGSIQQHRLFSLIPMRFVSLAIPVFFVYVGLMASRIPRDLGVVSALLVLILLLYLTLRRVKDTTVLQVVTYATAAFVVYLENRYFRQWTPFLDTIEIVYFVLLAAAIGITIRYGNKGEFKTTPMDYLVIFVVLFAGFLLHNLPEKAELGAMAVELMIIFYGCELIIRHMRKLAHLLNITTLATLTIFAVRGLI